MPENIRNEALRERLLVCAIRHFSQKGFSHTNMLDIATEADVSRGPLYYYFSSKAQLYHAAVRRVIDRTRDAYERILDPAAPVESVIRADYAYCLEDKGLFFLSQSDGVSVPGVGESWDAFCRWLVARKRQVFEAAAARGELRADCDIAELITLIYTFCYGILQVRSLAEKTDGFSRPMLDNSVDTLMSIVRQRYLA